MGFLEKLATKPLRSKAVELHKKGKTVDEIVAKFMGDSKIVNGLVALGIDQDRLKVIIEEEVQKHG